MERIDDSKMKMVNGGIAEAYDEEDRTTKIQIMRISCKHCQVPFDANVMLSKAKCPHCGEVNFFYG